MRLRSYVGLVVILSLFGLAAVYESVNSIRSEYHMAELVQERRALAEEIGRLQEELAELSSSTRLEALNRELALSLEPLDVVPEAAVEPLASEH